MRISNGTKRRIVSAICFLSFAVISLRAATDAALKAFVDSIANEVVESGETVGVSIGIGKDDEPLLLKGYGHSNLELKVPATAESVYRIGSITKQFTAAAILLLAEDGKHSLDDPMTRFLPDYPMQGHAVTVRQLLNHTSGIKSFTSLPSYRKEMHLPVTHDDIINRFKNEPFDFAPGEKFSYCNSGYYLLGVIVEKVSGKPYEEFLKGRIFRALKLDSTVYDRHALVIPNRAAGYGKTRGGKGFRNAAYLDMGQPFAAGSLASTVGDLLRWQHGLADLKLLRADSWNAMKTRGKLNNEKETGYGLGVFLGNVEGQPVIRHGGGINGFRSELVYLPKELVTIAVLTNTEGARPDRIANRLARHFLDKLK